MLKRLLITVLNLKLSMQLKITKLKHMKEKKELALYTMLTSLCVTFLKDGNLVGD